jgi:hypothetical protein
MHTGKGRGEREHHNDAKRGAGHVGAANTTVQCIANAVHDGAVALIAIASGATTVAALIATATTAVAAVAEGGAVAEAGVACTAAIPHGPAAAVAMTTRIATAATVVAAVAEGGAVAGRRWVVGVRR